VKVLGASAGVGSGVELSVAAAGSAVGACSGAGAPASSFSLIHVTFRFLVCRASTVVKECVTCCVTIVKAVKALW
jgi:hypothetical protein